MTENPDRLETFEARVLEAAKEWRHGWQDHMLNQFRLKSDFESIALWKAVDALEAASKCPTCKQAIR